MENEQKYILKKYPGYCDIFVFFSNASFKIISILIVLIFGIASPVNNISTESFTFVSNKSEYLISVFVHVN